MSFVLPDNMKGRYADPDSLWSIKNGVRTQIRGLWGFGGYFSQVVDLAMRNDDADALLFFMREAKMTAADKTFDGLTMAQYADKRGAHKCKVALDTL